MKDRPTILPSDRPGGALQKRTDIRASLDWPLMADTERNEITFSGFDSAWGAHNSGAICDLVLNADGSLRLDRGPVVANWDRAIAQAAQPKALGLHVWAVDQPICVQNETGCRPVEQDLARALMAGFGCGTHCSNLGNPCWEADARIWGFIRALEDNNYTHNPMAIPAAKSGRYYFECYPHPALLGMFDLDQIVKYKMRHKNAGEWRRIIDLLRSLTANELPIRDIGGFVREDLPQNKANEDKVDAIISAYTAAYWWKFGTACSTMIGDLTTGYIVTPHSRRTYAALARVFDGRMNRQGPAVGRPQPGPSCEPPALLPMNRYLPASTPGTDRLPGEPQKDWSNPVELRATDTSNIWRTSRGAVINSWMDAERMTGWRLWVRFMDEDGQPAVLFLPFSSQGNQQCGMKPAPQQMNRGLWSFIVVGAARANSICFQVCYCYEKIQ
jgi:predicted RNase H-like nuclease